jgi:hypothetical protein
MEPFERMRDPELEVELELHGEDRNIDLDVVDDLDDPWFALGELAPIADAYEIDPVHPLRRLSAWVRGRLAA